MGLLAPNPRKFFEKNLTKNFKRGCGANIGGSTVERTMFENKKIPRCKFFEKGAGKSFLLRKFSPRKKQQIKSRENPRRGFSLFLCVAKEFTLSCVLGRIIMGLLAPNPRKFFEKNLTKNFQAWVLCKHWRFNGRAHYV